MSTLAITGGAVSTVAAFAAKQVFSDYYLNPIRSQIDSIVDSIANARLSVFDSSDGRATLTACLTSVLSDTTAFAVHELVITLIHVANVVFFEVQRNSAISLTYGLTLKVARFATYFFVKSCFFRLCPAFATLGAELGLKNVITLSLTTLPVGVFGSPIILAVIPPIVFIAGEILGVIAGEIVYDLLLKHRLF